MQVIQDIFDIWPTIGQMAMALGREPDTVYRWKKRGRIPEDAWPSVIEKAATREVLVTAAQLMKLNAPVGQRGKPRKTAAA